MFVHVQSNILQKEASVACIEEAVIENMDFIYAACFIPLAEQYFHCF